MQDHPRAVADDGVCNAWKHPISKRWKHKKIPVDRQNMGIIQKRKFKVPPEKEQYTPWNTNITVMKSWDSISQKSALKFNSGFTSAPSPNMAN
jgi:hypothetical protein